MESPSRKIKISWKQLVFPITVKLVTGIRSVKSEHITIAMQSVPRFRVLRELVFKMNKVHNLMNSKFWFKLLKIFIVTNEGTTEHFLCLNKIKKMIY